MLADPLPIKRLSLAAHAAVTVTATDNWPRIDAGDGSARYVLPVVTLGSAGDSSGPATLRIAHSKSNEQKPVLTSRTLIRIDVPILGNDLKVYNSYAYAVIGMPQIPVVDPGDGIASISHALLGQGLVEYLVGVLAVSSTAATLDETKVNRIIAGES